MRKPTEILNAIIAQDPGSSMASKAGTMIDVLSRRQKIEDELNGLNVTRVEEENAFLLIPQPKIDTVAYTPLPQKEKPKK